MESQEGAEKELATVAAEELINTNKEDTQYEITVMEEKIAQMKPNMAAIVEYKKKVSRDGNNLQECSTY